MKRKIFYLMVFALTVVAFSSCSKDEYNDTRITYYPTLSISGDNVMAWTKGTAFQEPGYKCILNGEDVTSDVKVTSNLDINKSGLYTIVYSFTNADGFSSSLSRTVCVADASDAVEGLYYVDPTSNRVSGGKTYVYSSYGKDMFVEIFKNGDKYSVSDFIGGFYDQGRGYGSSYAMSGNMTVAADGTLTVVDSNIPGFSGSLESLTGKFDSATKTMAWSASWSGMVFNISLIKK
jgi:hypothetical protein